MLAHPRPHLLSSNYEFAFKRSSDYLLKSNEIELNHPFLPASCSQSYFPRPIFDFIYQKTSVSSILRQPPRHFLPLATSRAFSNEFKTNAHASKAGLN